MIKIVLFSRFFGGEFFMRVNIEAERVRNQLTKTELSERLGISLKTYAGYINGNVPIPSNVLLDLATLFCCTTDYLLGRNVPNSAMLDSNTLKAG